MSAGPFAFAAESAGRPQPDTWLPTNSPAGSCARAIASSRSATRGRTPRIEGCSANVRTVSRSPAKGANRRATRPRARADAVARVRSRRCARRVDEALRRQRSPRLPCRGPEASQSAPPRWRISSEVSGESTPGPASARNAPVASASTCSTSAAWPSAGSGSVRSLRRACRAPTRAPSRGCRRGSELRRAAERRARRHAPHHRRTRARRRPRPCREGHREPSAARKRSSLIVEVRSTGIAVIHSR